MGLFFDIFILHKALYNFNYWRHLVNLRAFPCIRSRSSASGLRLNIGRESRVGMHRCRLALQGWRAFTMASDGCRHDVRRCAFSVIEFGLVCRAEGVGEGKVEVQNRKSNRKSEKSNRKSEKSRLRDCRTEQVASGFELTEDKASHEIFTVNSQEF